MKIAAKKHKEGVSHKKTQKKQKWKTGMFLTPSAKGTAKSSGLGVKSFNSE